jgi:nitrogen fixation protein NifB
MNCFPLYPVADTPFEHHGTPNVAETARLREVSGRYLPQMSHCTRCRADAAGLLGETQSPQLENLLRTCADGGNAGDPIRPYVAVASMEGVLVNQHLGEASRLWIFGQAGDDICLIETRETPEAGQGSLRWREMATELKDCRAVVVSGAGRTPRRVLEEEGLRVIEMGGLISDGLATLFRTGDVPIPMRRQMKFCGTGCRGGGTGCA